MTDWIAALAWSGRVTMKTADWNDERGSTVTFALPTSENEHSRNPFHRFTKRRKGKAGTRFIMACHTDGEAVRHALYEDEVMLAGWNDSQQTGHTAKFWLCNDQMGHPFDGISRTQKLLVSLVEIDDDQQPIDQKMRERVEQQGRHPQSRPSYAAAMMCKSPHFHSWLKSVTGGNNWTEDDARTWLCNRLNIESRAELDKDSSKAVEFEEVRKAYLADTQGGLA